MRLPPLLFGLLLSATGACAGSTHLVLPSDLAQLADRYTIAGNVALFTPKISFGPYHAKARAYSGGGGSSGATIFNGNKDTDEDRHQGSFELATPSGKVRGKCVRASLTVTQHEHGDFEVSVHNGEVGVGAPDIATVVKATENVSCSLRLEGSPELRLGLDQTGQLEVQSNELVLKLVPIGDDTAQAPLAWRLEAGYLIVEADTPLGAVDTSMTHASATFLRDLPQQRKDQVAAVVMALVLLRDM